jgi:hypothetical protein
MVVKRRCLFSNGSAVGGRRVLDEAVRDRGMQLYRFDAHGRKIGTLTANCDLSVAHNAPKAGEKPNSPAAPPASHPDGEFDIFTAR